MGFFRFQKQSLTKKPKRVNYGHFTVFDNAALSAEDLEVALATYDKGSAWYKRDILGLRGAGAESIYIGFGSAHVLSRDEMMKKNFVRMSVGIDVGGRDATVATLIGVSDKNELCLVDGYYHKQGLGEYMTHDRYVGEITEKMLKWVKEYPALEFGGAVFCESAEKMFRTALSLELMGKVNNEA